ncbi:MAG: ABC transporter permease [Oscillospiraceae bacterium]
MKKKGENKYLIISAISVLGFIGIWYLCTAVLQLMPAYLLPSPIKVFSTFIDKFTNPNPDNGTIILHLLSSLRVSLTGFLLGSIVGIPLGVLMAWYKNVDRLVRPIFNLIRPIPPIAWIPLMIIWLGIGLRAKSSVIFFAALIPCVINTYSGIKQTNQVHVWVGRVFGASNLEVLLKVAIPTALPQIFTGLKISLGSSWISLVAAEMLASTNGLGYMIQIGRTFARADIILVGMLTIGLVGAVMAWGISLLEKKFVKGGNKD